MVEAKQRTKRANWDRSGLPAWSYVDDGLHELEKEELFRRRWQLVCHQSDLAEPGRYVCLDVVGERALVIRGKDGVIRAFHNVCRHRGSRVVANDAGRCRTAIVCPFHGWSYNLDGTLRGVARPETYPALDPEEWGLKPLELEIWNGFVFVRFKPSDQPSIVEVLARFDDELAPYRMESFMPTGEPFWSAVTPVNWKSVRDVDNEGYHVPMAHPGLQDLYGLSYSDDAFQEGASRSFATFNPGPGRLWSVRHYKKILPAVEHLPESHRRAWLYIGIFPNAVIGLYPDSLMFYQEFPLSTGETLQRGAIYRHADEDRRMRLARYLSGRIDRYTVAEDIQLTIWSYEAAQSSGFDGVYLSDLELGVKTYHDHLREVLPVLCRDEPPAPRDIRRINREMLEFSR